MSTLRSHISDALVQLRRCLLGASAVLFLSLLVHVLTVSFIHFTDMRFEQAAAETGESPRIIHSTGTALGNATPGEAFAVQDAKNPSTPPNLQPTEESTTELVLSSWDYGLQLSNDISGAVGTFAAWAVVLLSVLGVQVAAGGSVRGVHHMVNACLWALGIAMFATPWDGALPSIPMPGVMVNYESLLASSELAQNGTNVVEFFLANLVLPVALMAGSLVCAWKFCKGVEAGMYIPEATPFDIAVDKEIADIRSGIVTTGGGKTAGALKRTMDTPASPAADVDEAFPDRNKASSNDPAKEKRAWVSHNDREIEKPNASENGFRRPL